MFESIKSTVLTYEGKDAVELPVHKSSISASLRYLFIYFV